MPSLEAKKATATSRSSQFVNLHPPNYYTACFLIGLYICLIMFLDQPFSFLAVPWNHLGIFFGLLMPGPIIPESLGVGTSCINVFGATRIHCKIPLEAAVFLHIYLRYVNTFTYRKYDIYLHIYQPAIFFCKEL